MILKKVYIDRFAALEEIETTPLSTGVNVLYGPNEYGKSTFMEFVRQALFGFKQSRASDSNKYIPISGAAPKGRLSCVYGTDERCVLEREGWTKGGKVSLRASDGTAIESNKTLHSIFNIGPELYQNVFAVGLEELYNLRSLDGEELKSKIYGAGFGLGKISLNTIKKKNKKEQDAIFLPRGKKQLLTTLSHELELLEKKIAEFESTAEHNKELIAKLATIELEQKSITTELEKVTNELKNCEMQSAAFEQFQKLKAIKEELNKLPKTKLIDAKTQAAFEYYKLKYQKSFDNKNLYEQQLRTLLEKKCTLKVNKKLLLNEDSLLKLIGKVEQYTATQQNIQNLQQNLSAVRNELNSKKILLKQDKNIPLLSSEKLEWLSQNAKLLTSHRQTLEKIKQKQNQKRRILSPILGVALLGSLLSIVGYVSYWHNFLFYGGILFGTLSIILAFLVLKNKSLDTNDLNPQLASQWDDFCTEHQLSDSTITPLELEVKAKLQFEIAALISNIKNLEQTIQNKQTWCHAIEKEVDDFTCCNNLADSTTFQEKISRLKSAYQTSLQSMAAKKELNSQITTLRKAYLEFDASLKQNHAALQQLFLNHNVKNENEFIELNQLTQHRLELTKQHQQLLTLISNQLGQKQLSEDSIFKVFDGQTLQKINQQSTALRELKTTLNDKTSQLLTERGKIQATLSTASSDTDLLQMRNNRAMLLQQIRDGICKWTSYKLAETILEQTVTQYEREKQPAVLKFASEIFNGFTNGRYTKIIKPLDSEMLEVITPTEKKVSVLNLSRGTREQLYLAMRLGVICEYEKNIEGLPIIFDDIFVNFDYNRTQEAVSTLIEFAKSRQIIFLTCHEHMKNIFVQSGANLVELLKQK